MSILVIGGSGTIGREVVARLAGRFDDVRLATRNTAAVRGTIPSVRPVAFDFDKPDGFIAALQGVDRVFLMARPGEERADEVARPLLAAMRQVGVRQVVNLTGFGVNQSTTLPLRKLELQVEASGLRWTHLRPNFCMQNLCSGALLRGIQHDELALPAGEARISFVDARDVAAVAAEALCTTEHDGQAYDLTGEEAVSLLDVARVVSSVTHRTIRYLPQTDAEALRTMIDQGESAARAARRVHFMSLARAGALSAVSGHVAQALGRPATSLRAFANDSAHCWRTPSEART